MKQSLDNCMLRKLKDLKAEGCASKDKLQQEIQDHITETHGDNVEWFFCREIEVAWKKSMGSRFQKDHLLADEQSMAPKLRAYRKIFPRRTGYQEELNTLGGCE